ncbi:MAG: tRNA (adenosine(37)-N6)-dimethylallyltransferase MiaA [Candidatus Doudnabacteria bacterium]|nr:tRNA (adenosine(37)-N6)-dimethylallyltransferase MiaA [Candidatus Doudnabacteria bacterium]
MNKLVVILGPTASGKSSLAIKLAKKFNGEIISADSRQVYKGMNIGTGKVGKNQRRIVKHHLLDIISPKKQYTVTHFKHDIKIAIDRIMSRGKLPFLVGGTAFYIYAAIDGLKIPEVKPNPKLRRQLAKKSAPELFKMLKKLDPRRAKTIDRHNPMRLIRAIEIVKVTGKPVPSRNPELACPPKPWRRRDSGSPALLLGLNPPNLKQRIAKNVDRRIKQGMLKEVKQMLSTGITSGRFKQIGLTYALVAQYLKNGDDKQELVKKIKTAEWQYAKRQMTWFKRDKRIRWTKNQKQAERRIRNYLSSPTLGKI